MSKTHQNALDIHQAELEFAEKEREIEKTFDSKVKNEKVRLEKVQVPPKRIIHSLLDRKTFNEENRDRFLAYVDRMKMGYYND